MHMACKVRQPDGSETGYLDIANGYALTNNIAIEHQSHLVYDKVVYWAHCCFLYTVYLYIHIYIYAVSYIHTTH